MFEKGIKSLGCLMGGLKSRVFLWRIEDLMCLKRRVESEATRESWEF